MHCHNTAATYSANCGEGISIIGKRIDKRLVWDDAKVFLAVMRTGTLSGAASELGLGLATVSRRIDRLEQALNVALFTRQQSGYTLTADGEQLIPSATLMETAASQLRSANQRAEIAGTVRLATAENLATGLILPRLPELTAKHPGLLIECVTDIATANLHRRDADIALRMVEPERGNVTVQRLGTLGYGLYAAPGYRARGDDTDAFIGWDETHAHLPAAQWIERTLRGRPPALTTTSLSSQIAAVKAGLGLGVLPHFLAQDAGLDCVAADLDIDQAIYLVTHSDLAQAPRIQVVAEFLRDVVRDNRGRLSAGAV
ncbi:MAG: LysR family transcriptional regulator [Paracoccus sp. (in: a-proteobacteria)]|nr:LysR family transcriptional regulator [Paracoccus sp. (in: a-proteobacteria)]MDO5646596.1 LysR family transcriptional regulator [Paracoccus sp. (in: a-proteobacteria)]